MNRPTTGSLAIAITAFLWGTTGTAATFAQGASPLAIGAAALGIGGLLQAAIAIPQIRAEAAGLRAKWSLIALGAVAVAIYPLAFYSSMHYAGVAIGSVISLASAPLASGLLERIIDKAQLSAWWLLAVGLGIAGSTLLCLTRSEAGASNDSDGTLLGVALGLVAGATYATYSWVVHRLMGFGVGRGAAMGSVFGTGGLLLMPVLVATGAPLLATSQNFAVAAYMALVPMFLGYLLFGFGLTRVSAGTATTITLAEPAVATILAVVIVGERLSSLGWIGLAFIAIALLVLVSAPQESPVRVEKRIAKRRMLRWQTSKD